MHIMVILNTLKSCPIPYSADTKQIFIEFYSNNLLALHECASIAISRLPIAYIDFKTFAVH